MIFGKEATRDSSPLYPDGEIYEINALSPHKLVRCGGDESGGRSELLGKHGPTRCCRGPLASIPHMGPIQTCYGVVI